MREFYDGSLNWITPIEMPGWLSVLEDGAHLAEYLGLSASAGVQSRIELVLRMLSPTLTLLNLCGYKVTYLAIARKAASVDKGSDFCIIDLRRQLVGVGPLKAVREFARLCSPVSTKGDWYLGMRLVPLRSGSGTAAISLRTGKLIQTSAGPFTKGWLYLDIIRQPNEDILTALQARLGRQLSALNHRLLALLSNVKFREPSDTQTDAATGLFWMYHPSTWMFPSLKAWRNQGLEKVSSALWSRLTTMKREEKIQFLTSEAGLSLSSDEISALLCVVDDMEKLSDNAIDAQYQNVDEQFHVAETAFTQLDANRYVRHVPRELRGHFSDFIFQAFKRRPGFGPGDAHACSRLASHFTLTQLLMNLSDEIGFESVILESTALNQWRTSAGSSGRPAIDLAVQILHQPMSTKIPTQTFTSQLTEGLTLLQEALTLTGLAPDEELLPARAARSKFLAARAQLDGEAKLGDENFVSLYYTNGMDNLYWNLIENEGLEALGTINSFKGQTVTLLNKEQRAEGLKKLRDVLTAAIELAETCVSSEMKMPDTSALQKALTNSKVPALKNEAANLAKASSVAKTLGCFKQILSIIAVTDWDVQEDGFVGGLTTLYGLAYALAKLGVLVTAAGYKLATNGVPDLFKAMDELLELKGFGLFGSILVVASATVDLFDETKSSNDRAEALLNLTGALLSSAGTGLEIYAGIASTSGAAIIGVSTTAGILSFLGLFTSLAGMYVGLIHYCFRRDIKLLGELMNTTVLHRASEEVARLKSIKTLRSIARMLLELDDKSLSQWIDVTATGPDSLSLALVRLGLGQALQNYLSEEVVESLLRVNAQIEKDCMASNGKQRAELLWLKTYVDSSLSKFDHLTMPKKNRSIENVAADVDAAIDAAIPMLELLVKDPESAKKSVTQR